MKGYLSAIWTYHVTAWRAAVLVSKTHMYSEEMRWWLNEVNGPTPELKVAWIEVPAARSLSTCWWSPSHWTIASLSHCMLASHNLVATLASVSTTRLTQQMIDGRILINHDELGLMLYIEPALPRFTTVGFQVYKSLIEDLHVLYNKNKLPRMLQEQPKQTMMHPWAAGHWWRP